jgi:hypothetical protein
MRKAMLLAVLTFAACGDDEATDPASNDPSMLADQQVTVGANGGGVNVSFDATGGQRVRITLVAEANTIQGVLVAAEPYAGLTTPSGADAYHPPLETAANNQNTEDVTLAESGRYTLTVFDGSNAGRRVRVTVQKLP